MIPSKIGIIDTETTGLELTDDIIECAVYTTNARQGSAPGEPFLNKFFSATRPIPPEVSAVHHICDDDVAGQPLFRDYAPLLRDDLNRHGVTVLAAHNAEFDRKMLGEEFSDFIWICTYKCALHAWPDAPNHKNETLCYYLGVGMCGRKNRSGNAHSAYFDTCQTAAILEQLLLKYDLAQLIEFTNAPKNLTKMPFGKHAGKTWKEIDGGYLIWMTKNIDDTDLVALAKAELARRRG